jgi:quercetin dioxygenase-like cupin family protein
MSKESRIAREGAKTCHLYTEALEASQRFRAEYPSRRNVVKAADMPFEDSPDGRIKHLVHPALDTKECCVDIYMQFLAPGKASGRHRHLAEEVFYVVEGRGYDLHWDVRFDCRDEFIWEWEKTPKRFDWQKGDFVYIPPYVIHQHFNAEPGQEARIIVVTNRILKDMGFDWFDQLERAEGY